jgi:hypothetical protein
LPTVHPCEHLDPAGKRLRENRAQRLCERIPDNRGYDDADVEGFLKVRLQGDAKKPSRVVGTCFAPATASVFEAANMPPHPRAVRGRNR